MDFHGIDLNLLAAFDALMSECHVTRAAARVGVSQPAMSAALSRLRTLFGDPLFLRSAQGLLPTPKAREMAEPISQALQQIKTALLPKPLFEPASASLTFNIGMSEYPAFVLLPALASALKARGPGLSLAIHGIGSRDNAVDLLDAGTIDVAVGVPPTQAERRILSRSIMQDQFVCLLRRGHPALQSPKKLATKKSSTRPTSRSATKAAAPSGTPSITKEAGLDLALFLELDHLLVSPEGDRHGLVDQALAYLGKRRRVALSLPQMFAAPTIVAHSDMVCTVMKRVAGQSPHGAQLDQFTPPVALPDIAYDLMWHRRNDAHPAQQWLREEIAALAASL
ncbi:LysR family transcriptional regulator [Mitsuaria sp. 7]|uniref:LysR family transcriptional regulator n=1 Tax=Mitsuaria sp. 7 TaxID=1658665 RepID=UPI0007DD7BD8|nr:LysR family transcriptional regulator [Mitsuaria sp. 7]ANH67395.1 LysR family transcriptional regulator [Mitsuaria sp. 7]